MLRFTEGSFTKDDVFYIQSNWYIAFIFIFSYSLNSHSAIIAAKNVSNFVSVEFCYKIVFCNQTRMKNVFPIHSSILLDRNNFHKKSLGSFNFSSFLKNKCFVDIIGFREYNFFDFVLNVREVFFKKYRIDSECCSQKY